MSGSIDAKFHGKTITAVRWSDSRSAVSALHDRHLSCRTFRADGHSSAALGGAWNGRGKWFWLPIGKWNRGVF